MMVTNSLTVGQLMTVTSHSNQTRLVEQCFRRGLVHFEEIEWLQQNDTVFQWIQFPDLTAFDYEYLIDAKIPVLQSDYGEWVGITSYWSPYEVSVYPEILNAVYQVNCTYEDVVAIKQKTPSVW